MSVCFMQRLLIVFAILLSCPQSLPAQYDRYMKQYTNSQFMGAVLVARGSKILFEKAYGFADIDNDVANTTQTKFNICSLTKQFTALAILQLAEQGRLKLEDPVSRYYPEAPAAWGQITLYHLLSHTSGIPNPASLTDYPKGIA